MIRAELPINTRRRCASTGSRHHAVCAMRAGLASLLRTVFDEATDAEVETEKVGGVLSKAAEDAVAEVDGEIDAPDSTVAADKLAEKAASDEAASVYPTLAGIEKRPAIDEILVRLMHAEELESNFPPPQDPIRPTYTAVLHETAPDQLGLGVAELSGALRQLKDAMDEHMPPERISEVTIEDVPDMMMPVTDSLLEVIKGAAFMRHKLDNVIDTSSAILNGGQPPGGGGGAKKQAVDGLKRQVAELQSKVSNSIPKAEFDQKVDQLQQELQKLAEAAKEGNETEEEKAETAKDASNAEVRALTDPNGGTEAEKGKEAGLDAAGVEKEETPEANPQDEEDEKTRENLHANPPRITPTAESGMHPILVTSLLAQPVQVLAEFRSSCGRSSRAHRLYQVRLRASFL